MKKFKWSRNIVFSGIYYIVVCCLTVHTSTLNFKYDIYSIANLIYLFINNICIISQQHARSRRIFTFQHVLVFFVTISLLNSFLILIWAEDSSSIDICPHSLCTVSACNSSKSALIMMLITCRNAISAVYVEPLYHVATSRGAKIR